MIKNNYEDEENIELDVPLLIPPLPIIQTSNKRMIYRRVKRLIRNIFALRISHKKIYSVR
jgi:hypothetical protein